MESGLLIQRHEVRGVGGAENVAAVTAVMAPQEETE